MEVLLPRSHSGRSQEAGAACVATVLVVAALLLLQWWRRRSGSQHSQQLPKGPPAWPVLGHLPLLRHTAHKTLADLAVNDGYGPIMGLRLGLQFAIVVSDAASAKELLSSQDKIFANRPPYEFIDSLFYGYDTAVTFSSYSAHWIRFRKIYTLELFTAKRLQQLQHIRQEEVRGLMRRLQEASCGGTETVDMGRNLADMTSNTTARLLHSKTLQEVAPELPELIQGFERLAFPTLGDFFPPMKFCLDVVHRRRMRALHNRIDKIIDFMIEERRRSMQTLPASELPNDFLQVVLSKGASDGDEEPITNHEIKGIMLDILAGGVHTSSATLEWAMTELLRHPACLRKLREEIDSVVGEEEKYINDDHIDKLPYLKSTVKEVFRMHPVVPLLIPRSSSQACSLGKYRLPKQTQVFVNVWAIGRDPKVWEKPGVFWPERYDGKEVDVKGQHYELLPFGAGRRVCPGIRLGLSVVHVTLANLIRMFDWELPHGQQDPSSIDMSEKGGIGNSKALPLLVIPKARRSL